jgi:hypothetical protein
MHRWSGSYGPNERVQIQTWLCVGRDRQCHGLRLHKWKIRVISNNCTISIPEQGPLAKLTFTNAGGGTTADSLATADVTTIAYTETSSQCPDPGLTSTDGTYTGTVTVKAFKNGV